MLSPSGAPRPPQSDFLVKLKREVTRAYQPEIDLACKVAVLTAAGYRKSEVAARVGATGAALKQAFDRAAAAAGELDIAPHGGA